MTEIARTQLDCGIPLVVEQVDSVASLALNWLLPAGSATDPANRVGLSTLLGEYLFRGAGDLDSRQLSDTFDRLGVRRSSHVDTHHMKLSATMLGHNLGEALPVFTSMVLAPMLPPDALDSVRNLCLQSLDSLQDEPQDRVMLELRRLHRPAPFNRSGYGEADVLKGATVEELRKAMQSYFRPGGSIITAAGDVDPAALASRLNSLLTDFAGNSDEPQQQREPLRGYQPIEQGTAQVHIGMAYDAPAEPHDDSILEHLATAVLSGGTSGRLFTEVRQKRSLCYSVGASYRAGRDSGAVSIYAGTTPERAQETLDVTTEQVLRMTEGATDIEFKRAVTRLKSRLVMQGESTRARAAALGADQFRLGRPRSLDERIEAIERITLDQLNAYLARREFAPFTIASIGPAALAVPQAAPTTAAG